MIKNINTHSYYSILKSNISIDKIIENAVKEKQQYVFLTDFNLYGSIEFRKKAIQNNLKPIVGLEVNHENNNLILFSKTNEGYKNIIKISSFILSGKPFDINDFLTDIVVIFKSKYNPNLKVKDYFTTDKKDSNYLPLNEVNFINKEDYKIYKMMNAIQNALPYAQIQDDKNSQNFLNNISEENENTKKFINLVDYDFSLNTTEIIKFKTPNGISTKEYLHQKCFEGLKERLSTSSIPNNYLERLNYELSIIDQMGFNDYFLIVNDFISEARNKKILIGPGRGSAAGSLVSYSLFITSVDPIKYGLIFERFLNPNRKTMPDIDIDIMDVRREEIIEYIFNKYGFDHVAHIITFQRIKAKMAIRDVARALEIDLKIVNRISKLISTDFDEDLFGAIESNKELKEYYTNYKELFDIANELIGCPRQTGTHAAGIVISESEMNDIVPTQTGINGDTTTQISMEHLEELGILKIDLLGLSNLTIINNVLAVIKLMNNKEINLEDIPLNDEKVFNAISAGKTLGIFQLESPGMRDTLKKVKPQSIEDISLVSAMFRPGPQQNIGQFVKRRFGLEEIEYVDERSKDILEPTNGIIVYQEQVIEIVKRVANFSAAEADIFRKIISKKNREELEKVKGNFLEGAIKNGYSEKHAIDIYNYIEKFASYGFNHSHSISYALISYWMMFLKEHFTIQFMSVLLSSVEGNHDKINAYCNECVSRGIKVKQPSFEISNKNFSIHKNEIYFGFSNIKGIGYETAKKLLAIRNDKAVNIKEYGHLVYHLINNGVGESTINLLIYAGALDYLGFSRKYLIENLQEAINSSKNMKSDGKYLFEPKWVEVEQIPSDVEEFNNKQFDLIGFAFNKNKIDDSLIEKYNSKYQISQLSDISESNKSAICLVKVLAINERMTKYNKLMAFIKAQDETIQNLCNFNFDAIKGQFKVNDLIICEIKYDAKGNRLSKVLEVINE